MDLISRIQEDRNAKAQKIIDLTAERDQIDVALQELRADLAQLDGALQIIDRYNRGADQERTPPSAAAQPVDGVLDRDTTRGASLRQAAFTGKDAVLGAINGQSNLGVAEIVERVKKMYGMDIQQKTAGNILWVLSAREGKAVRTGKRWSWVSGPEGSSQGETGAVAAPESHETSRQSVEAAENGSKGNGAS